MTTKEQILSILDHGDVFIQRCENGYVIYSLNDERDRITDQRLNTHAVINTVFDVPPEDYHYDNQNNLLTLQEMLYYLLSALGETGDCRNGHLEIKVYNCKNEEVEDELC